MATTTRDEIETDAHDADPQELVSRRGTPTWELAYLYPRQGDWTEAEYLSLDSGRQIEFVDGCLEFLPLPTLVHRLILKFLMARIDACLTRTGTPGLTAFAPCPVKLRKGKWREPDLFYVRPERIKDLQRQPEGVDLAIEIVSEGEEHRKRDLVTNRAEYAEAQFPEYWIVDPRQKTITVLVLQGPAYRVHGEFGAGAAATSILLPGFEVSVDATISAGEAPEQHGSPNGS